MCCSLFASLLLILGLENKDYLRLMENYFVIIHKGLEGKNNSLLLKTQQYKPLYIQSVSILRRI